MPRLALTGPVASLDEWIEAAQVPGWEILSCPLIELFPQLASKDDLRALLDFGDPQIIALTSIHAVPMFLELAEAQPVLRSLPIWTVGARTGQALRRAGLNAPSHIAPDASHLAEALLLSRPRPDRVVWPRGDQSDELARLLRAEGIRVLDPVAYINRPRSDVRCPPCEWVFFASPSAVERWLEAASPGMPGALAIGETTLRRLREADQGRFSAIIPLPHPTVAALRSCLVDLGRAGHT